MFAPDGSAITRKVTLTIVYKSNGFTHLVPLFTVTHQCCVLRLNTTTLFQYAVPILSKSTLTNT